MHLRPGGLEHVHGPVPAVRAASITTFGFFPALAITARSAAGLLVIRTVSSLRPSSVIRTITLRCRCRSIPTTCCCPALKMPAKEAFAMPMW